MAIPSGLALMGGYDGTNEAALVDYQYRMYGNMNDLGSAGVQAPSNIGGLWIASRINSIDSYVFGRAQAANYLTPSAGIPNTYACFDAEMRGFECNAQLRGAWIGGGLSTAEMAQLNGIWEEYESIFGR